MSTTVFPAKDPRETRVITLDASAELETGETLTGTPSISITLTRGTDPNASSVVTSAQINASGLSILLENGTTVTIAIGHAVQAIITGGLDGVWYEIAITCATSNPDKVLTLKAILPVSAS